MTDDREVSEPLGQTVAPSDVPTPYGVGSVDPPVDGVVCDAKGGRDLLRWSWKYHCGRDRYLQTRHGITCLDYARQLARQSGRCAACGCLPPKGRAFDVDEDHETHEWLGLLCRECNRALTTRRRAYARNPAVPEPRPLIKPKSYAQKSRPQPKPSPRLKPQSRPRVESSVRDQMRRTRERLLAFQRGEHPDDAA